MRALVGGAGQGCGRGMGQTGWRGRAERWAGQGRQVGGAGQGGGWGRADRLAKHGQGRKREGQGIDWCCREEKVLFELLVNNVAE